MNIPNLKIPTCYNILLNYLKIYVIFNIYDRKFIFNINKYTECTEALKILLGCTIDTKSKKDK